MREIITKKQRKMLKHKFENDPTCCLIYLKGKQIKTKDDYYAILREKLQLNESFSNNLNAYSDMLRDPFTYFNKEKIVFLIKRYDKFLRNEPLKLKFEMIFDEAIIPFWKGQISDTTVGASHHKFHLYCEMPK